MKPELQGQIPPPRINIGDRVILGDLKIEFVYKGLGQFTRGGGHNNETRKPEKDAFDSNKG
jgi:hypothetical protein